ncbi:MAG: PAS domain S-box protein [Chloroflexi bacterium]|nr:PAS domain S-box protein [Chloroflexota bacterium]
MGHSKLLVRSRRGSYFRRIWHRLTDPSAAVQRLEDRRQAQFLAAFYVVLVPVAFLLLLIPGILRSLGQSTYSVYSSFSLVGVPLVMAGYVVSRTRYYCVSAALIVGAAAIANLAATAVENDPDTLITILFSLIPVLLSSFLLPMPATLALIVAQALALVALPSLTPAFNGDGLLGLGLSYYVVASVLIVLLSLHRNLLEQDRRARMAGEQHQLAAAYNDLENRIAARTAQLSALNDDLRRQIADRERVEASLVEERNLLRALIENVPDAIFVLDLNGRYMLDNAAHRRLLGVRTMDEVIGKSAADFFPAAEAAVFQREELGIIQTGQPLLNSENAYLDPARQRRWASVSKIPFRDSQGQIIGLVGIVHDVTDLKQAEAVLQQAYHQSEQRLSEQNLELSQVYTRLLYQASLLENVSEAVVATDLDGIIQSWNRAAETLYGYPAEQVIGTSAWEFFRAGLSDENRQVAEARLRQHQPWQGEFSFRRRDGHQPVFMISVAFVRDREGKPTGIVSVGRDITERKRAEAAERDQRLFAEALRETAAAINSTLEPDEVLNRIFLHIARIVPCDTAGIILIENGIGRVVRYWGTGMADEAIAEEIRHFDFPVQDTPTLRQMYETGEPLLINDTNAYPGWVIKDGHNYFASYIGAPIKIQGEVIGFLGLNSVETNAFRPEHRERMVAFAEQVAIAIRNAQMYETIRNHAAELVQHVADRTAELERERAQLSTILDSMNEGVVSAIFGDEQNLRPLYLNRALVELTGYAYEDWKPELVWQVLPNTPEMQTTFRRALTALQLHGYWQGQLPLRRKDGSVMDAEVTCTRVNLQEKHFIGVVAVIRDISQEKALQEQRSRFVANASHELRTPLTNLMTRLWLLRKRPDRLEEHLLILEDVANRMRYLVEDLLDVSRLERGLIPLNCAPMDLRQTVLDVIQLQAAEAERKNVRLDYDLPDTPLIIEGDARRIHQVITNLTTNAINYTPESGQVRLSAELETDSNNHASHVIIHVRDSGIGIPPEHLPHLFQPFYRVGEQGNGTGLGLAIAYDIVQLHGGSIRVESEVGRGSCFSVRLALQEN